MKQMPVLYIVIPCYNEEDALPITAKRLVALTDDMMEKNLISPESRILLVNDGSRDRTWEVIRTLHERDGRFEGLKLAHNVGHMNALWAGMTMAAEKCDCMISIDADLQDDVNAMYGFLEEYQKGADVVYGVRCDRSKDTAFKRITAQSFYRVMNWLGAETVYNHADYRLLSRRALESLLSFGEVNMFLRGIVPMLGYKTAQVEFVRGERVAGESKYPLRKMVALAVEGITSMSIRPIRYVFVLGVLCALLGVGIGVYVLTALFSGNSVAGWASTMMSMWILGGIQLVALGVIGEYIGKIYMETKRRPKFIMEEYLK